MNNNEAIKLLDETFKFEFNSLKFSNFLNELFNGFYPQPKSMGVYKEYGQQIVSMNKLGNYRHGKKSMEIMVVRLRKGTSLDKARTMQRNVIAKWLKNGNINSALVAFTSEDSHDWRLSFVKMDYNFGEGNKVLEELTPAKRYSFLVGPNEPNYTCKSQFIDLIKTEIQKPSIDEIEKAFSIEKVTKEFFEKYKNLYHSLKENLDNLIKKDNNLKEEFENKQISTIDFSKKLLGQIVFLYFLQKKGWLGIKKGEGGKFEQWGKGSKRFIQELFYQAQQEKKNFFNDYLEPLFYHALATDRRADGDYYDKFNCKIPFLNGGLFEPLNGYNWGETDINLDNNVFEEIFKTFDEFNFTIKEDEPLEKEVAVDPEMLGKVFENLLDVEDRKSKGAFYTPREIVHYMCQQSLINYLETNINIPREDLEFFIQKGDLALEYLRRQEIVRGVKEEFVIPNSIKKNAKELERLLTEIKICDPAVGSGAFPVGMMNEIIKARTILLSILKKTKTDYELKRETIENSLYGVDIEPSAVEITKLRFWLSLIVDEEDMNNIKPLPNLENKIMCGNSLIEEFEGIKLYIDPTEIKGAKDRQLTLDKIIEKKVKKSEQKLKELRQKQKEFFDEENRTKKNKLREDIEKIEWDFIEETLREQGDGENMKKLEQYKKSKSKPFFLWKLYFNDVFFDETGKPKENPGFDVVIANPPYVSFYSNTGSSLSESEKENFVRNYVSVIKKNDRINTMNLFSEKGIHLLRIGGSLSFIVNKTMAVLPSYKSIREYLLSNSTFNYLITNLDPFEAVVDCIIYGVQKKESKDNQLKLYHGQLMNYCLIPENIFRKNKYFEFHFSKNKKIIDKIELIKKNLDDALIINRGVNIGGCFDQFLSKEFKEGSYKYLAGTKAVKKYYYKWNNKFDSFMIFDVKKEKELRKEGKTLALGDPNRYEKERLFLPESGQTIISAYSDEKIFSAYGIMVGTLKNKNYSLKYLCALLNSELITFYAIEKEILRKGNKATPHVGVKGLKSIPIPYLRSEQQKPFIEIVDKILEISKGEDYLKNPEKQAMVKAYERRIDKMVYDLYGLIKDEIKIVEESLR